MGKVLILRADVGKSDINRIKSSVGLNKNVTYKTFNNIIFYLDSHKINVYVDNISLKKYDFVYFRTWSRLGRDIGTAIAHYLNSNKIPFFDVEPLYNTGNKLVDLIDLSLSHFPIPETIYIPRSMIVKRIDFIEKKFKYPLIMKALNSSKGQYNYLIKRRAEIQRHIDATPSQLEFIFEPYIENDFDYRLFVINYKVKVVYKRIRDRSKTHLNNLSRGGKIDYIPLDEVKQLISLAEKSSRLLKRNIAGVDILISSKYKRPYILEVNNAPGISAEKAQEALGNFLLKKISIR